MTAKIVIFIQMLSLNKLIFGQETIVLVMVQHIRYKSTKAAITFPGIVNDIRKELLMSDIELLSSETIRFA